MFLFQSPVSYSTVRPDTNVQLKLSVSTVQLQLSVIADVCGYFQTQRKRTDSLTEEN